MEREGLIDAEARGGGTGVDFLSTKDTTVPTTKIG